VFNEVDMAKTILKMSYHGDIRRAILEEELTYERVCKRMQATWPTLEAGVIPKYADEEGDLCTLCSASFPDFLALARADAATKAALGAGGATGVSSEAASGQRPGSLVLRLELQAESATKTGGASKGALIEDSNSDRLEHPLLDATFSAIGGFVSEGDGQGEQRSREDNGGDPDFIRGRGGGHRWGYDWAQHGHGWKHHCPHGHGWGDRAVDPNAWLLRPRKIVWLLSRLRASGALSSRVAASFCANLLPGMVAKVANNVEEVGRSVRQNLTQLQTVLHSLVELVKDTKGLEHCETALAVLAVMVDDESPDEAVASDKAAGEALLMLLTAVDMLPFDDKLAFLDAAYHALKTELHSLLDSVEECTPYWAKVQLQHPHVTCDGCDKGPIQGLRFRCKSCADFDLCGECYAKKTVLHSGAYADHEFECIPTDWSAIRKRKWDENPIAEAMHKGAWAVKHAMAGLFGKGCKGKGKKGKCGKRDAEAARMNVAAGDDWKLKKGKFFKGKGKGKGEDEGSKEKKPERSCASPGCTFLATWHPTHCCGACARKGCACHGPRCARQTIQQTVREPENGSAVEVEQSTLTTCEAVDLAQGPLPLEPSAPVRRVIPVSLGDGQQLSIEWLKGEEPEAVAQRFLTEQGLPLDELSTIVAFMAMADEQLQ